MIGLSVEISPSYKNPGPSSRSGLRGIKTATPSYLIGSEYETLIWAPTLFILVALFGWAFKYVWAFVWYVMQNGYVSIPDERFMLRAHGLDCRTAYPYQELREKKPFRNPHGPARDMWEFLSPEGLFSGSPDTSRSMLLEWLHIC